MAESAELKQMVMSLRVSELQVLLGYAGRNKHGRKHELLTKALHLLKAGCSPAVQMKIKELYRRRFPTKIVTPADLSLAGVHSTTATLPSGLSPIPQLTYDGHTATSPLLPVSLLGPNMNWICPTSHQLCIQSTLTLSSRSCLSMTCWMSSSSPQVWVSYKRLCKRYKHSDH
uniref:E3 SUMO-protein ligase PIAS1-like n=1 Tax=Erpetoichthys calabaricus TaxID=27687 RepID=A0A8C4TAQ8_ERPCA